MDAGARHESLSATRRGRQNAATFTPRQKQPECLRMLVFVALQQKITALLVIDPYNDSFSRVRRPSTTGPPGSGPRRAVVVISSRIVG